MQDPLHFGVLGSEEVQSHSDDVLELAEFHHLDSLMVDGFIVCFHVSEVLLVSVGGDVLFPMLFV